MTKEQNTLFKFHGHRLNGVRLHLVLGSKNAFGAQYFHLYAQDPQNIISNQPIIIGLYNSGAEPAFNWVEIVVSSNLVNFNSIDSSEERILITRNMYRRIFRLLSSLLPPGSHFMIEYDSPHWLTTRKALAIGIPPLATPLGSLLYDIGFGVRVKDWDLAEGGKEGWRKLWGYNSLNESHLHARSAENAKELRDYLERPPHSDLKTVENNARRQAKRILKDLYFYINNLKGDIK